MCNYLCVFMCIYAYKNHTNCLYNGFSYELLVCDGFYENCYCAVVF